MHHQREFSDVVESHQRAGPHGTRASVASTEAHDYSSTLRFTRPPMLSAQWWDLHQYSWKDIETTLKATSDPMHLWHILVAEGCDIPPTAIKIPWSRRVFLDYTEKAGAFKKLVNLLHPRYARRVPPHVPHKLTAEHGRPVPPLPTQRLTPDEWTRFIALFGTKIVSADWRYADVFNWRGIDILPYAYCRQNKLLQVEQVMEVEAYCRLYGKPTCEINTPFEYLVGPAARPYYSTLGTFYIDLPPEFTQTDDIPDAF